MSTEEETSSGEFVSTEEESSSGELVSSEEESSSGELVSSEEKTETTLEENISTKSEIEIVETEIIINDIDEINIASKSEILTNVATQSEMETEPLNEKVYATGLIPDDYVAPIVGDEGHFEDGIYSASPLPSKYDSRQHKNSKTGLSYISPVRDQGILNTCWAFSTLSLFEASLRIRGLVKNETESNLSEAALAYFIYNLENVTNNSSYLDSPGLEGHDFIKLQNGKFLSRGGNYNSSLFMASSYAGVVKENSDTAYSRLMNYGESFTLDKKYAFNSNDFVLENAYFINKDDTDIIKQKIMENGAVGISYYADNMDSGYSSNEDAYMHKYGSDYYYFTDKTNTNHAINIVGWDDTISADRFYMINNGVTKKAKNPGGWLCRNSWGEDADLTNKGYFWMSYEEPSLKSTLYAVDAMKANKYKYNYHYDTIGSSHTDYVNVVYGSQSAYGNVFKVPENQNHVLEATSVAIDSSNTVLTIDVYVNDKKMNHPSDGTLKSSVTVEREAAGIYTIPLEDKVLLNKGTYFSIILRGYSKTNNELRIFCDDTYSNNSGTNANDTIYYYNSVNNGQSFKSGYSPSNYVAYVWVDCNGSDLQTDPNYPNHGFGTSYRIKGLANPVEATAKVSFDSDGGIGTMEDLNVLLNTDTKLTYNAFYKPGYKFSHWVDKNGNEYINEGIINVNSDLSLKAVWTPVDYTIQYNTNGGTISESSVKKTYGKNIVLETPIKQGYTFLGWYKEASLTNLYDGNSDISIFLNDSVTIYAKWGIFAYTITYDLGGVNATKPNDIIKTYSEDVTLEKPTNIPSGCEFIGWYKDSAYKYKYTGKGDLTTAYGTTVVIYAKWKQKIIYDANGHGTAPSSLEVSAGNILLPSMSATGYTFGGWYKESECVNFIGLAGHAYYVTGPITFYAKWTPITYRVTLKLNGGSIISGDVKEYTYGIGATLPKDVKPSKSEEEFIGWYDNANFKGNIINKIDKSSTGDKVFYAKYLKAYTITFEPGEGEGTMKPQIVYEGKSVVLDQSKFTKSGYTFNNWKASNGKTYVDRQFLSSLTNDITLVATWKKNGVLVPSGKVSNMGGGSSSGGGGGGGGGSGGGGIKISNNVLKDDDKANVIDTNNKLDIENISDSNNKVKTEIRIDRSVTDVYNSTSAEWSKNENNGKLRLKIKDDEGNVIHPAYGFIQLDSIKTIEENNQKKEIRASDTYFFDENGDMVTGWVQTYADKWYYFNTENNSEIGKMAFGWKKIDGSWYYFALEGSLYRNTTTPDGYNVDVNGKWVK